MEYLTAKNIIDWIDGESVDKFNEESVMRFTKNLQNKIELLDFKLSDGKIALGYAGDVDSNIIHNL